MDDHKNEPDPDTHESTTNQRNIRNTVSRRDSSRFLDELSVANQLMALAGTPDINRPEPVMEPPTVVQEIVVPPRRYCFGRFKPYSAEDLEKKNHPKLPKNQQEQIRFEHSYAIVSSYDDYEEEKDDSDEEILSRKEFKPIIVSQPSTSSILQAIPSGTNSLKKVSLTESGVKSVKLKPEEDEASSKEKEGDKKHVFNDNLLSMYISRINAEENKVNFKKKLKIVIQDCQIKQVVSDRDNSRSPFDTPERIADSSTDTCSEGMTPIKSDDRSINESEDTKSESETVITPPQTRKKRKLVKKDQTYDSKAITNETKGFEVQTTYKRKCVATKSAASKKSMKNAKRKQQVDSFNTKLRRRNNNGELEIKSGKKKKGTSSSDASISDINSPESGNKLSENKSITKKRQDFVLSESFKFQDDSNIPIDDAQQRKKSRPFKKSLSSKRRPNFESQSTPKPFDKTRSITLSPNIRKLKEKRNLSALNSPTEKKKKLVFFSEDSSSDNKSLTPDKLKEPFDVKDAIQVSSPNVTKSLKKKVVKRESLRFVMNEDEPPLFSQPDMMVKVKEVKDEDGKKDIKEHEIKKDKEDEVKRDTKDEVKDGVVEKIHSEDKRQIKETEMNAEMKVDECNKDIKKDEIQKEIKNEIGIEIKKEIKHEITKEIKSEVKKEIKKDLNKETIGEIKCETFQEVKVQLKDVEKEMKDEIKKEIKDEVQKEKKDEVQIEISEEEMEKEIINVESKKDVQDDVCHQIDKTVGTKNKEDTELKNSLDNKMSILSENTTINNVRSKKEASLPQVINNKVNNEQSTDNNYLNINKSDLNGPSIENEIESFVEMDIPDLEIVPSSDNESDDDKDYDSCENSVKKGNVKISARKGSAKVEFDSSFTSETDAIVDTPKPERKSRRLIKKKEFFEFVSEPPNLPSLKKKSTTQNQKAGKNKESRKRNSSTSGTGENSSSEDDPDKLWCICRKPHNNRFMIQCDTCEDWFHGTCVGVTKQQGCQLEKQKKEWICPTCRTKEHDEVNAEEKIMEKKSKDAGKARIVAEKKIAIKSEHKSDTKENSTPQNSVLSKSASRFDKRDEEQSSPAEDVADQKLRAMQKKLQAEIEVLTKQNKKDLASGKQPSSKSSIHQKSKPKPLPISRTLFSNSGKNDSTSKGNSSSKVTASSTSPVNKKQSPHVSKTKGVKVVPKKRQNCVQCHKATAANSCYCSTECIEKHAADCLKGMNESTGSTKRLTVFDRSKGTVIAGEKGPTAAEIVPWLKENPSCMIACSANFVPGTKKEPTPKKEPDSTPNTEQREAANVSDSAKTNVRGNVKKTLKNILMDRSENSEDIKLSEEDIRKIAVQIEEKLHARFKGTCLKYRTKYRSLMFNIKDPRNQGLFRKILRGEISPDRVVHMTATELASVELSKWREQEMQHHLDMIKRVQLEQQKSGSSLLLKKTHKGEVEIEDDFTTIIEQDIPKTLPKGEVEDGLEIDKEEREAVNDTTQLHRTHLFDLNCKICTGKVVPPPDENTPKKVRIAHSISVDVGSPNAPDSIEKAVSRVVEGKSPVSSTGDDSLDQEPTSTVSIGSPDYTGKGSANDSVLKSASSVWKGFIFMQDIAKFVTSAYKVSGQTDRLHSDLPDTIQVCGRIIPDQVWDYLSKIKQSGNKELIIIQFQAANDEEAVTYNTFYSYLNSRKRYGVVSNYSKKIKDFYIVPLAATSPVPTVLMPFDGPGLPSPRPHLLLGVIVRHRLKQTTQSNLPKQQVSKTDPDIVEGSYTPPIETRSYTPPLPAQTPEDQTPEIEPESKYSPSTSLKNESFDDKPFIPSESDIKSENATSDGSYNSLQKDIKTNTLSKEKDEDKPYDPEQDVLSLNPKWQDKKLNIKRNEKTPPNLENLEDHKKILDALTKQVEKTDREVSALKNFVSTPKTNKSTTEFQTSSPKTVDINSVADTGMSTFLDLPANLQEILNTVRLKSADKDIRSDMKGDVDMRLSNSSVSKKHKNESPFGLDTSMHTIDDTLTTSDDKANSLGATPPPPEDEPGVAYPSDPRIKLRTSYQEPLYKPDQPPIAYNKQSTSDHSVSMKKPLQGSELVEIHHGIKTQSKNFATSIPGRLLPVNWNQFREPPPPGIEPSELQSDDIYSPKAIKISDNSVPPPPPPPLPPPPPPPPPQYASSSSLIHDNCSVTSGFPPPAISFPTHLPPGFPVHPPPPPPPPIKSYSPSITVQSSFAPPPPPIQNLPSEENSNAIQDQWSTVQTSGYQPDGKEWGERASHWNDGYSSERSSDYCQDQNYKREGSLNNQWERSHRYNRGNWHKRSLRGHKFENRRGKRSYPYRKNHTN